MAKDSKSILDPVSSMPGVGPKRQTALKDLGIVTVYDLLQHYPFRYEDLSVDDIATIEDKQTVVLQGQVINQPVLSYFGARKSRLNFVLKVGHIPVPVTFFNQPYYKQQINKDDHVIVYGRFDGLKKSLVANRLLAKDGESLADSIESVYPANASIKQGTLRKLIKQAYDAYADYIPDPVPDELQKKYQLMNHRQAIEGIHFPETSDQQDQAIRALKFEELFSFQLELEKKRTSRDRASEYVLDYEVNAIRQFTEGLPFEPTQAQKRVVNEICKDFKQDYGMRRMLQGDVGSGKTLVAAMGVLAAQSAGRQSAMMVPTEILAEQHASSLSQLFEGYDLNLALLTGSTPQSVRKSLLEELAAGQIDFLVGTHALIQEPVIFKDLGFVIIDEQHRFGVHQREQIEAKGLGINVLYMTATPIPRSLALTSHGDMDMSILDQMPQGRKPITTRWTNQAEDPRIIQAIQKELDQGGQVYVINALIEESETSDQEIQTALDSFQVFKQVWEPQYPVGLLHGRMPNEEKEEVMQAFKVGQIRILVSTTVIEVGVDVPNANLMVIYDADRFGLAQLHQLRGRVGRGQRQASCILVAHPKTEEGIHRLQLMTESQDGFYLSEKDLEIRGPGDVLGQRQSGLPQFKVADIVKDYPMLEITKQEAIKYLAESNDEGENE